jgi:hypothetical protein
MKLASTSQLPQADLPNQKFDLFVGASGYESRATFACSRLDLAAIRTRVAFAFTDRITHRREQNDEIFARAGVEKILASGDSCKLVREQVRQLLESVEGEIVRVFIDYTSMTRSWYAGALEALQSVQNKKLIECVFSYSPAKYTSPRGSSPNAVVGPLPGFCGLDVPDKPSALIIGLGYERDRALGLFQYVDPAIAFAFYTDPVLEPQFLDVIEANNATILNLLPKENIYTHPLADLQRTGDLLLSLCSALRDDYRIILAPLGVKPFSLICLLLATRFRNIDVWRVSPGTKSPPQEREALGRLLTLKAVFVREESQC